MEQNATATMAFGAGDWVSNPNGAHSYSGVIREIHHDRCVIDDDNGSTTHVGVPLEELEHIGGNLVAPGVKVSIKAPGCDRAFGVIRKVEGDLIDVDITEPGYRPYSVIFRKFEDGNYREAGHSKTAPSLSIGKGAAQ